MSINNSFHVFSIHIFLNLFYYTQKLSFQVLIKKNDNTEKYIPFFSYIEN